MQFSDTTNGTGLIQDCEDLCSLGETAITGNTSLFKTFTRYINQKYDEVISLILQAQDNWDWDDTNHTDQPVGTTDLVANQQDYAIDAKWLKVKRVEVTYNGTDWYTVQPFDIAERKDATDTTSIGNDFSKTDPYYDINGNSIHLYPIPSTDSTAGLKVWFTREKDDFTTSDTTQEPGFDSLFHQMLSIGASIKYKMSKGLDFTGLLNSWDRLAQMMTVHYGNKQEDFKTTVKSAIGVSDYE